MDIKKIVLVSLLSSTAIMMSGCDLSGSKAVDTIPSDKQNNPKNNDDYGDENQHPGNQGGLGDDEK
ncbi:MAG: hypothetical protein DBO98_04410 [Candidatus Liberibacter europaeus]|nr:hypothetical protein [Candidatus Liberibacter europaeus]